MEKLFCPICNKDVKYVVVKANLKDKVNSQYFCKECGNLIGSNEVLKEIIDNSKIDVYQHKDDLKSGDWVIYKSDYPFSLLGKVLEVKDNLIKVEWQPSDVELPEILDKSLVSKIETRYKKIDAEKILKEQEIQTEFERREKIFKILDKVLEKVSFSKEEIENKEDSKKLDFLITQACIGSKVRKIGSNEIGKVEEIIKDGIYKIKWNKGEGIYFGSELELVKI